MTPESAIISVQQKWHGSMKGTIYLKSFMENKCQNMQVALTNQKIASLLQICQIDPNMIEFLVIH